VLLGRTVEPAVLVAPPVGFVAAPELPLDPVALDPTGRAAAADAPAAEAPAADAPAVVGLAWLGGGLPIGRFAGGVPARC
jgi:hypothetical protein